VKFADGDRIVETPNGWRSSRFQEISFQPPLELVQLKPRIEQIGVCSTLCR